GWQGGVERGGEVRLAGDPLEEREHTHLRRCATLRARGQSEGRGCLGTYPGRRSQYQALQYADRDPAGKRQYGGLQLVRGKQQDGRVGRHRPDLRGDAGQEGCLGAIVLEESRPWSG